MDSLWPWLGIAGLGALHGLSPTGGWMFAAAWGLRDRDVARVWHALLPLAIGHGAAIAVTAFVLAQGAVMDRRLFQLMAGVLLAGAAAHCLLRGAGRRSINNRAGHAGMALWSFLMASAQGAGLMLLPAPGPMCIAGAAAPRITLSGSLVLALAAVTVHKAAMLLTTGVVASGACRVLASRRCTSPGLSRIRSATRPRLELFDTEADRGKHRGRVDSRSFHGNEA